MVFDGVRAVLFDLDGTLLDSAPDLGAAAEWLREQRGLPPLSLQAYRAHAGSGARGMLRVAFGLQPGDEGYEPLRAAFLDAYQAVMHERTGPFDDVPALVQRLGGAGLPWGVVTNKAERFALPLTRRITLFETAAALVCGDTTPHAKPHPAPLLEAGRRLGLPPQACIYVGDDQRDIVAGRAAGMRTVAAGYGYLGPDADVRAWGADAIIDSPLQLLNLLELP